MTVTTNRSDGGVDFRLDLDTDRLLPGRIATGGAFCLVESKAHKALLLTS